jgi:Domain of unknown function (DUF4389)
MNDPAPSSEPLPPPPPPSAPPPGDYPVHADCDRQEEYNRALPFFKFWLLAIPHYFVLFFLWLAGLFVAIFAFFAVLFTGRYPRGAFNYIVGVKRWSWNVASYVVLLTDRYPPFSLDADPTYPAQFDVPYPEDGIANWRPLVQWLLAIPYLIVAGLLAYVALAVAIVGAFVILFTGKLPEGMFKLILIPYRWQFRGNAYALFVVDRYPPFEWE